MIVWCPAITIDRFVLCNESSGRRIIASPFAAISIKELVGLTGGVPERAVLA